MSITVRAPAKVNLVLGVGAPREDGYHALNTVYQAISLYDDVRAAPADRWSVSVTPLGQVDVSGVPLDDSNIVLAAGRSLIAHHGLDLAASIEIHKGIPVAGGLAGGSADAAATLVALDRLWELGTSDDDLLALAARLGSDVPFALVGGSAHGLGRGEVVAPVPDRGTYWWVVVTDDDGLSTPEVYRRFDALRPSVRAEAHTVDPVDTLAALDAGDPEALGASLRNDLQDAALSLRPGLADRLELVRSSGCEAVLLSGSGPTVLGLARTQDDATEVRRTLLEAGLAVVHVATGPVAGAHVVEYA